MISQITFRLFECLNSIAKDYDEIVFTADIGVALFGAGDMMLSKNCEFIGSPYYACMGIAVPAAIGAACARPNKK